MPSTRRFSQLRDEARRDPVRARRIDAAKTRALEEQASYRLGELRHALGLTRSELADMLGKSQSMVTQIEHGKIALSLHMLRQIVAQLGGEIEITAVFEDRRVRLDA